MHALPVSLILCSLGLVVVLLARRPGRRLFGAGPAFSLWLLPPVLALTPWLPALPSDPSMIPSLASLPGVDLLITPTSTTGAAPLAPSHWLAGIWGIGLTLMLLRLVLHHRRVRRRGSRPSPELLQELRELSNGHDLRSVRVHPMGPAVLWGLRPWLLLPTDFMQRFPVPQLRTVLAHEFMHLRRGDPWWNLLAELCVAVLWFHPLAWLALPRLRLDMELACDDAVLRRHPDSRAAYAKALLSHVGVHAPLNLIAWLNPPQLKERLIMISRPQSTSMRRGCSYLLVALLMAAGTIAAQAFGGSTSPRHGTPGNTDPLAVAAHDAPTSKGHNVVAPTPVEASRMHNPPAYPLAAQKALVQGDVGLRVKVDTLGAPREVRITHSSGNRELDRAAIQAAERWQFKPGTRDGKPSEGWAQVKIKFRLQEP